MRCGEDTVPQAADDPAAAETIDRREFLRMAAATLCTAAGLGAGLGSLVAGCDDGQRTSNTTATIPGGATTSSNASTTTVTEPTLTTVVAGPPTGRVLKVGVVSARTGHLALSGKADDWWMGLVAEARPDGVWCRDGLFHPLRFITRDSRSDPGLAAQEAVKLIRDDRVDILLCSGRVDLVNPVADQAEALACPFLCSLVDWRRFVLDRGATPGKAFRWTYAYAIGLEDIAANFVAMWDQVETNKKVGLIFPDDAGGRAWTDAGNGLPGAADAAGYDVLPPSLYAEPIDDFTPYISEFAKAGCEVCCGAPGAVDLVLFWKQSLEQGYHPKVVTVGEALSAPHVLQAMGAVARNMTAESLWQPDWPFRDSITGMTCGELAEDYMAKTGDQWTAALAQYSGFEWAFDVLKRVEDLDSRTEFMEQIRRTSLETCLGLIDVTAPVDVSDPSKSKRPAENVCKAPVGGMQWVAGDTFEFEPRLVTNVNSADLTVTHVVRPMEYES
ncbi:MAG: ABC transporter substrate-binding protein [Thermoleophilia bacterium]|nr:ABC transporter substrate-binding protein [Thermoleophilia bacterium]